MTITSWISWLQAKGIEPIFSEDQLLAWFEHSAALSTRVREHVGVPWNMLLDSSEGALSDALSMAVVGSILLTDMRFEPVRLEGSNLVFEVSGDITELVERIRRQRVEDARDVRKDDRPCAHDYCGNLIYHGAPEDVIYCGRRSCAINQQVPK